MFRILHELRLKMGAPSVHVAEYAKKWKVFYNFFRRTVRLNAAEFALEQGFEAVACGHVHYKEDSVTNGVRYLNTGAWTEMPVYCIIVDDSRITLAQVPEHVDRSFFADCSLSNLLSCQIDVAK